MENLEKIQEYSDALANLNKKREERDRLETVISIDEKELITTKSKIQDLNYEIIKYKNNDKEEVYKAVVNDSKLLKLIETRKKLDDQLLQLNEISNNPVLRDSEYIEPSVIFSKKFRKVATVGGAMAAATLPLVVLGISPSLWPVGVAGLGAFLLFKPYKTNLDNLLKAVLRNKIEIEAKIIQREKDLDLSKVYKSTVKSNVILETLENELKENILQKETLENRIEDSRKDLAVCKIEINVLEDECSSLASTLEPNTPQITGTKGKQKELTN